MKNLGNISEGMSDTVGVIVLIAVMAAVISVAGVAFLSGINTDRTPVVLINQDMVANESAIFVVLENEGGNTLIRDFTRIYVDKEDVTSDFKTPGGGYWELFASSDELWMVWTETELPQDVGIISYQDPQNPTIIYVTGDPFPWLSGLPTLEPTQTPGPEDPPVANFSGTPLLYEGAPFLVVNFKDSSTNSPNNWFWDFGDGFTSTEQNPDHKYTTFGTFTVSLIATNVHGNDTETKTDYVNLVPSLSCNNTGLNGYYFEGKYFSGQSFSRSDERIVFADNAAHGDGYATDISDWPVDIIGSGNDDLFSVMYEGYLVIDTADEYTFYLTSDDGSRLWIDDTDDSDTPVVENWYDHSPQERNETITLTEGYHPVKVKMYEQGGDAVFHLEWESGNMSRRYVESFCRDDCCAYPRVDFESDVQTGSAPFTVNFTDLSTGATSWLWEFGDGTNSTDQNPDHEYLNAGYYTVNLTASNIYGSGIESKTDYIHVLYQSCQNAGIVATYYKEKDFTIYSDTRFHERLRFADYESGYASDIENWAHSITGTDDTFSVICEGYLVIDTEDEYTFYLTSDDGSNLWIDGSLVVDNDGDHSPREIRSSISLTKGLHSVKVDMYEQGGEAVLWLEWSNSEFSRRFVDKFINGDTCPEPVAQFSSDVQFGASPLNVKFNDLSSSYATNLLWDFGDGSTSNVQNPVHEYQNAGVYTVSLKAIYGTLFDYENKTGYINVTTGIPPVANFTGSPLSGDSSLSVKFSDLSVNATDLLWDFGDETTSTEKNPEHTYSAGVYNVSLKASNNNGFDYENKTDYITVTDFPQPAAWWKFDESSGRDVLDSSGNGNDGRIRNSYYRQTGVCNSSLHFDGTETYVRVPNSNTLDAPNSITYVAWLKPETTSNYQGWTCLMDKGNSEGSNYRYYAWKYNGVSSFSLLTGSSSESKVDGFEYNYGAWQHLAFVADKDDGTAKLYVNGDYFGETPYSPSSNIVNDELLTIGRRQSTNYYSYKGLMDEVMLFTEALTADQIRTIYETCTP